jgi:hypothetical protein
MHAGHPARTSANSASVEIGVLGPLVQTSVQPLPPQRNAWEINASNML